MTTAEASCVWAVHRGRKTGLFPRWDACREQVEGYEGAVYRCFKSPKKASEFARNGPAAPVEPTLGPPEYIRVPGPEGGDDATELLTVFVDGYVKKTGDDPERPGIPVGGYGVWFGADDDPRNVKEKFPLPGHTTERCEIAGVTRAIQIVSESGYAGERIVAVEGPAVPDGMRRMIAGAAPRKNPGLFDHLWRVATTCGLPVSILYLPVAKGARRADRVGALTQ